MRPGMFHVDLVTWRPVGSWWERLVSIFTDTSSTLNHTDVVYSDIDRLELDTETCGIVHLEFQVLLVDFGHTGFHVISEQQDAVASQKRASSSDLTRPLGQWIPNAACS